MSTLHSLAKGINELINEIIVTRSINHL